MGEVWEEEKLNKMTFYLVDVKRHTYLAMMKYIAKLICPLEFII